MALYNENSIFMYETRRRQWRHQLKWSSSHQWLSYVLEYMALNERGGELFKRDFRKLWRYNENQCWITEKEIKETNNQNCLKMISEKQSVVSSKQSVVFISSL